MKLSLNCDLAEQDQLTEGSPEHSVMPFIHQANICCGVHAGNLKVMKETAILAKANDVEIGAHPSYPDRENFGRKSLNEIKEVLTGMSLYLGMEIPNWPPDNIAELSKKLEEAI